MEKCQDRILGYIFNNQAEKVVAVLKEFGFGVPELNPNLFLDESKVIRMGLPPLRIEIITSISGVNFDECYSERVFDTVDGINVNIISLKAVWEYDPFFQTTSVFSADKLLEQWGSIKSIR